MERVTRLHRLSNIGKTPESEDMYCHGLAYLWVSTMFSSFILCEHTGAYSLSFNDNLMMFTGDLHVEDYIMKFEVSFCMSDCCDDS